MNSTLAHPSRTVATVAGHHPGLVRLARVGWFAKGVVYVLLGALAVPIGWRGLTGTASADDEASQVGAVARIAESSLGSAALWAVGLGLMLYVLWRLVSIVLPTDGSVKAWATRAGYAVSAVMYSLLAWTALSLARGQLAAAESEEGKVDRISRQLMESTAGRWGVGLLGVVIIVVGAVFVIRGASADFRDELEPGGVGPFSGEQIVTLGRIGWTGRGCVMAVIGWFLLRAALDARPDEAVGFDGALRQMTSSTFGALIAVLVALALIVYGVFCLVASPKVRLKGAG
jgi:Domain of Unknown Function (DUF1206)